MTDKLSLPNVTLVSNKPKRVVSKSRFCNKCGVNEKYPDQGLCYSCLREKQRLAESKRYRYEKPEDLEGEVWVEIDEAPDYYVSNMGRVKSVYPYNMQIREKILSQREARKGGYLKIDLDRYNYRPSVHRLVATYFIPNPENKPMVNHKDLNKQNNKAGNLEWVTRSENGVHAFNALKETHKFYSNRHGIRQTDIKTGEVVAEYESIVHAIREGVVTKSIYSISKTGVIIRDGYKWETLKDKK